MSNEVRYPLLLQEDTDGSWMVSAPDFPEVTSFGGNREGAMYYGRNAIEEAIAARKANGFAIPDPSRCWLVPSDAVEVPGE